MSQDNLPFKTGQRVHVEFDGEFRGKVDVWYNIKADGGYINQFWPDRIELIVTAAEPESWPPQVGDTWEAGGDEYYARENRYTRGTVIVEPFDATARTQGEYREDFDSLRAFKALNPVLVRRRENG